MEKHGVQFCVGHILPNKKFIKMTVECEKRDEHVPKKIGELIAITYYIRDFLWLSLVDSAI